MEEIYQTIISILQEVQSTKISYNDKIIDECVVLLEDFRKEILKQIESSDDIFVKINKYNTLKNIYNKIISLLEQIDFSRKSDMSETFVKNIKQTVSKKLSYIKQKFNIFDIEIDTQSLPQLSKEEFLKKITENKNIELALLYLNQYPDLLENVKNIFLGLEFDSDLDSKSDPNFDYFSLYFLFSVNSHEYTKDELLKEFKISKDIKLENMAKLINMDTIIINNLKFNPIYYKLNSIIDDPNYESIYEGLSAKILQKYKTIDRNEEDEMTNVIRGEENDSKNDDSKNDESSSTSINFYSSNSVNDNILVIKTIDNKFYRYRIFPKEYLKNIRQMEEYSKLIESRISEVKSPIKISKKIDTSELRKLVHNDRFYTELKINKSLRKELPQLLDKFKQILIDIYQQISRNMDEETIFVESEIYTDKFRLELIDNQKKMSKERIISNALKITLEDAFNIIYQKNYLINHEEI